MPCHGARPDVAIGATVAAASAVVGVLGPVAVPAAVVARFAPVALVGEVGAPKSWLTRLSASFCSVVRFRRRKALAGAVRVSGVVVMAAVVVAFDLPGRTGARRGVCGCRGGGGRRCRGGAGHTAGVGAGLCHGLHQRGELLDGGAAAPRRPLCARRRRAGCGHGRSVRAELPQPRISAAPGDLHEPSPTMSP